MYSQKPFLLPFSSNWTLAFLISFLYVQTRYLCSFQVAGLSFHLCMLPFCVYVHSGAPCSPCRLSATIAQLSEHSNGNSHALRWLPLKISQLFWASALQGNFPQVLPSRSHLKSMAAILFLVLLLLPGSETWQSHAHCSWGCAWPLCHTEVVLWLWVAAAVWGYQSPNNSIPLF